MSPAPATAGLKVLFFGHLPQLTGCPETPWPLPDPPTVAALLESLYQHWPALRAAGSSLRVAVNLEYSGRSALIPAGAEVAIMPPVQGG